MPTALQTSENVLAVRLGKVRLQSIGIADLLSNEGGEFRHVVTVNSEIFVYAHEHPEFGALLDHTLNTIDGRIVQFLCALANPGRRVRKLAGSDFIYNLADYAARHEERIFLLGADAEANRGTIEVLRTRYPGLTVEGYSPAFCPNIEDPAWKADILARIADFRPWHLVVCFGPMKQEMWISQNAGLLTERGVRCAYGLGGTLDFVSGRKKRAPKWMQIIGAEWLFRLFSEPRRRLGRTAKMFKMPYFAIKFRKYQFKVQSGTAPRASARSLKVNQSQAD